MTSFLLPEFAWTCTPFRVGFFEKPEPNLDFLGSFFLQRLLGFGPMEPHRGVREVLEDHVP